MLDVIITVARAGVGLVDETVGHMVVMWGAGYKVLSVKPPRVDARNEW